VENTKIKATIIKHLKSAVDYLVQKGYEVKFKNINKIIDEVNKVLTEISNIDNSAIVSLKIEMFVDLYQVFNGEFIFHLNDGASDIRYLKLKEDSDDEQLKSFVGSGKICFDISLENDFSEKLTGPFLELLENSRFIDNYDLSDDYFYFEIPIKFKVVKYLIWNGGKHDEKRGKYTKWVLWRVSGKVTYGRLWCGI